MTDAKPFASLSPTLLARKGHAKPAMRPQSFRFANEGPNAGLANAQLDDLGWDDMGHDPALTPHSEPAAILPLHSVAAVIPAERPVVVEQQKKLAAQFEAVSEKMPRLAAGSKSKAAFTLRLDAVRHLRLRLVCAVNHRSAQQIVTLALDEYLARQPENSRLTAQG